LIFRLTKLINFKRERIKMEESSKRKLDELLDLADNHNKKSICLTDNKILVLEEKSKSVKNNVKILKSDEINAAKAKVCEARLDILVESIERGGKKKIRRLERNLERLEKISSQKLNENFYEQIEYYSNQDGRKTIKAQSLTFNERFYEKKKIPTILWNKFGKKAFLRSNLLRIPIMMSDVQAIITTCLLRNKSPINPSRVCNLYNGSLYKSVVILVIDGIGTDTIVRNINEKNWITNHLHLLEVINPAMHASTIFESVFMVPIADSVTEEQSEMKKSTRAVFTLTHPFKTQFKCKFPDNQDTTPLKLRLMLSEEQLLQEGYPTCQRGKFERFVYTKDKYAEVNENSPMLAIDCEMCMTKAGNELTYVCVVDENLDVLYKSYVKPYTYITNYLTEYSGISRWDLQGVTTRIEDVQDALRQIIPDDCILVGHSLNSDLRALKMIHPYVIDTSIIYNIKGTKLTRTSKTKLKHLSSIFLKKEIQTGTKEEGHCPEEDAIASLELAMLKLRKGYEFGDICIGGLQMGISEEDREDMPRFVHDTIMVRDTPCHSLNRVMKKEHKSVTIGISKKLKDEYNLTGSVYGDIPVKEEEIWNLVHCTRDENGSHDLTYLHADLRNDCLPMETANDLCMMIYSSLPENSLFVPIFNGDINETLQVAFRLKINFD